MNNSHKKERGPANKALWTIGTLVLVGAIAATILWFMAYRYPHVELSLRVFTKDADCVISGAPRSREKFGGEEFVNAAGNFLVKTSTVALEKYLREAASSTSSDLLLDVAGADLFRIRDAGENIQVVESNIQCVAVVTGSFGELDVRNVDRLPEVLKIKGIS